jgi:hypothetical protein
MPAAMSVPPATMVGTTSSDDFPFEYHLYRLYRPQRSECGPTRRRGRGCRACERLR